MGAANAQYYLNPLTFEAQMFLNSLETYGKTYNQIDLNLCDTLRNVVCAIDAFLDQNPVPIVATGITKLIAPKEFSAIQSIYHCTFCKKDLGKSADKAVLHLTDRHRVKTPKELRKEKRQAEQKRRETNIIKLPKKVKTIITGDMAKFFADQLQVAEKLKQIPEYEQLEKELLALLTPLFPDKPIKLYKFGSRMTGIGTRNSDLDIYVDIDQNFNSFENRASEQTMMYLRRAEAAFKKNKIDWHHLLVISGARVPIIRVCNAKTNIECDIGFSNSLSFFNTKMLEYIFQQQPIARRMCIFMKKWLERTRLNEHFSTYTMSLMVIYFLQVKNHFPPIEALQNNMLATVLVGPWIANFMEKPLSDFKFGLVDVNPPQCKQILKEFCQYYATFKFETYAVCPYLGRPNIEIKKLESMLPERYTSYVEKHGVDCALQLNASIVVQDPLQMNHNVAKRLTRGGLKEFRDFMKQTADIFAELK